MNWVKVVWRSVAIGRTCRNTRKLLIIAPCVWPDFGQFCMNRAVVDTDKWRVGCYLKLNYQNNKL